MNTLDSGGFSGTLLTVNIAVVVVGSLVLLTCLPKRLRARLLREGGFADCWTSILLILGLALIPLNLLILYVHWQVIPIPMALEAVSRFDPDPEAFREKIEGASSANLRAEHFRFLQDRGLDKDAAHELQRDLWCSWPLFILTWGLIAIASTLIMSRTYVQLLRDLEANAEKRCLQERSAMQPWEKTLEDLLEEQENARKQRRRSRHRHGSAHPKDGDSDRASRH